MISFESTPLLKAPFSGVKRKVLQRVQATELKKPLTEYRKGFLIIRCKTIEEQTYLYSAFIREPTFSHDGSGSITIAMNNASSVLELLA